MRCINISSNSWRIPPEETPEGFLRRTPEFSIGYIERTMTVFPEETFEGLPQETTGGIPRKLQEITFGKFP